MVPKLLGEEIVLLMDGKEKVKEITNNEEALCLEQKQIGMARSDSTLLVRIEEDLLPDGWKGGDKELPILEERNT